MSTGRRGAYLRAGGEKGVEKLLAGKFEAGSDQKEGLGAVSILEVSSSV
jgi:hypothetical protein